MPKIQLIQMIFWSKTNEGKITFLGRASVCLWPHDSHWQADFPTRLLFFCKWKSTKTMNHTDKLIVQLNSFFANTKAQKSRWWPFENVMCWLESGNVLTLQIAGFPWIEAVGPFFWTLQAALPLLPAWISFAWEPLSVSLNGFSVEFVLIQGGFLLVC